jgi:hypothetical protein
LIHKCSTWKTFIHSCGSVYQLIPEFLEAGFDILNPVQCSAVEMEAARLKEKFGDQLVFWGGGVDTQQTIAFGTPEQVYREVRERIQPLQPQWRLRLQFSAQYPRPHAGRESRGDVQGYPGQRQRLIGMHTRTPVESSIVTVHETNLGYLVPICLVATLGGLLFGYDTGVISGAIEFLTARFGLDVVMKGWASGCVLIGCATGVLIVGPLSDRFGRKKALLSAAVLFLLSAIGTALPKDISIFILFRFLGGIGIGIASMSTPMYISEIAPPICAATGLGEPDRDRGRNCCSLFRQLLHRSGW